jgi:hypothetical protein
MKRLFLIPAACLALAAAPALADDLTGAKALLCSALEVSACESSFGCDSGPATDWKVPTFVEIDLAAKTLRTTRASGEERSTVASVVERKDGRILLQGIENGRAFSFLIREADGAMTVAVARDELTVSVFGACTPLTR